MVFLEIDTGADQMHIQELNKRLANKNNKIFLFYYMDGCGHCTTVKPEWAKIKNVLRPNRLDRDDIVIASINQKLSDKLTNAGNSPSAFPTMRFITNKGNTIENYEDADFPHEKDRKIDSFIAWIKSKTNDTNTNTNTRSKRSRSYSRSYKIGGKWTRKYKRSINCKRPRGFSQKQYCKYGRRKTRRR